MRAPAQFVAGLLVMAVVTPTVVGFGPCCKHKALASKASASSIVMHHQCGQEQMQGPVPVDSFFFRKRLSVQVVPEPIGQTGGEPGTADCLGNIRSSPCSAHLTGHRTCSTSFL